MKAAPPQVWSLQSKPDMLGIEPEFYVSSFELRVSRVNEKPIELQNGFGAKFSGTSSERIGNGIAELHSSSRRPTAPFISAGQYSYEFDLKIAPEDARQLSQNLEIEVVATPRSFGAGQWVYCGQYLLTPSVRSPNRTLFKSCNLSVKFDSIKFYDKRDGKVFKEWK
jgi:hypothetical protein